MPVRRFRGHAVVSLRHDTGQVAVHARSRGLCAITFGAAATRWRAWRMACVADGGRRRRDDVDISTQRRQPMNHVVGRHASMRPRSTFDNVG